MVVAILAAIAGISCGLGLFATFRVNHEPLARLAAGSPPLQLALNNRVFGSDLAAPVEARLPSNGAAKLISAPVIIATPSPEPTPERSPSPSTMPNPAPEQSGADSAIAGDSSAQAATADATAENKSNVAVLPSPPSNPVRRLRPSRRAGRRRRYRISNRPLRRRPRLQPSKRRSSMPRRQISDWRRSRRKQARAKRQKG
jgi:hypothetical protein